MYFYRVRAYNSAGDSSYTANVSCATLLLPPANLTATALSGTQIRLTWKDTSTKEKGFKIERSADGINFSQIATTLVNVITYINSGLTAGTKYYYRIKAYSSTNESNYTSIASAVTTLTAPSALTALAASSSSINLKWLDNSLNETGFKIERSTDNKTFSEVGTAASNIKAYSDTGLNEGTRYYYRIRAYNGATNSSYTVSATAVTLIAAPTNLTATASSGSKINLSWTDNSSKETGFKIERSTSPTTGFVQVATTGANITTYTNTGLVAGKTYYYRVRAYSSTLGNSSYSEIKSATAQ
jgi:hypothetical protein